MNERPLLYIAMDILKLESKKTWSHIRHCRHAQGNDMFHWEFYNNHDNQNGMIVSEQLHVELVYPDDLKESNPVAYNAIKSYADKYISYHLATEHILESYADKEVMLRRFSERVDLWDQEIYDMEDATIQIKRHVSQLYPKFGYVYIVRVRDGRFKIGMTEDWHRRKKQLGTTIDDADLNNAHVFLCGDRHQAEAALHRWFDVQRIKNELFFLNAAQEQALRAIEYCDGIDEMLDTLPLPTEELRAQAKELRNK